MTDRARIRIAAATTALFLAVLSAAGLATHRQTQVAPSAPTAAVAAPFVQAPVLGQEHVDD